MLRFPRLRRQKLSIRNFEQRGCPPPPHLEEPREAQRPPPPHREEPREARRLERCFGKRSGAEANILTIEMTIPYNSENGNTRGSYHVSRSLKPEWLRRHGRPCAGHERGAAADMNLTRKSFDLSEPYLESRSVRVDGRAKPGHDTVGLDG